MNNDANISDMTPDEHIDHVLANGLPEACNVCDGDIETPNVFGYCNEHLNEMAENNQ